MRHLLGELALTRSPLLGVAALLVAPLVALAGCGVGDDGDDGAGSADCALLVRLDGVVFADTGRVAGPGAPPVGEVIGTADLSSCNDTGAEGIAAGPYFAEDPPSAEARAVQGLDPALVVAVRDEGSDAVRFLVDPEAPPAEVDAAVAALDAG